MNRIRFYKSGSFSRLSTRFPFTSRVFENDAGPFELECRPESFCRFGREDVDAAVIRKVHEIDGSAEIRRVGRVNDPRHSGR